MRTKDLSKIELIFAATLKLFVKDGYAGITMSKIAKTSGIGTGTIYIYFKNKEELINALYYHLQKILSDRFVKNFNSDIPFKSFFKSHWINYLKHRIEFHNESVFLEQYYYSGHITESQKLALEQMKSSIYEMLQEGQDKGFLVSNVDKNVLLSAVMGFIRDLADEHVAGRYLLNAEKIENAFDLSWKMVKQ